jgi:addiction module RelE/StbE family toxin
MRISWADAAKADLIEVVRYISTDNQAAAWSFYDRVKHCVGLLPDNPRMGRQGRIEETRELIIPDSPYIVVYRIKEKTIQILTGYHGSRRFSEGF